jgi:drug/metabolite transporter (DMT)-like permease
LIVIFCCEQVLLEYFWDWVISSKLLGWHGQVLRSLDSLLGCTLYLLHFLPTFFLKNDLPDSFGVASFWQQWDLACSLSMDFQSGLEKCLFSASALFFAAHIIALGKWSNGRDVYAMAIVQLAMCALLAGLASIPDGYSAPPDREYGQLSLLQRFFVLPIAFVIQTWSQAHMTTTKVAVILTMEVVFAAIFAMDLWW